jgi:hypothetical protein
MDDGIKEARQIVKRLAAIEKRTEPDRWRLAELTFNSGLSSREWAKETGMSQSSANRYKRIWERWGQVSPRDSPRPSFTECWDLIRAPAPPPTPQPVKSTTVTTPSPPPPPPPPPAPAPIRTNTLTPKELVEGIGQFDLKKFNEKQVQKALTPRMVGHQRWFMAKAEIVQAQQCLRTFISENNQNIFPDEFADFLRNDLKKLEELLELAKAIVGGTTNIDWDAELAKLTPNEKEES